MRLHSMRGRFGAYLAPEGDGAGGAGAGDGAGAGAGGEGQGGAGGGAGGGADNRLPEGTPGWYGQLNADHRDALIKGGHKFNSANDAVGKLLEYDRTMGSRIAIPGEGAKPEEITAFRQKLGVPDKPEGYEFKAPDGQEVDPRMVSWAGTAFHKHGVPKAAAEGLAQDWNAWVAEEVAAGQKQWTDAKTAGEQQLSKEWGGQAEANRDLMRRAAAHLGITEKGLEALQRADGYVETNRRLAKMGQWFLDDAQRPGSGSNFTTETPEAAETESKRMLADPQIARALNDRNHPDHAQLMAKLDRLQQIRSKS